MAVCPTLASLVRSALAPLMVHLNVASALLAILEMVSPVRTLTSAKRSQMPAIVITECTAVRTQSQATTACPVPRASLALSLSEEEWSRPQLKNRFAHPETHAKMVATTATKMQTVSTWASSRSLCTAVSASPVMLGMGISVERTVT